MKPARLTTCSSAALVLALLLGADAPPPLEWSPDGTLLSYLTAESSDSLSPSERLWFLLPPDGGRARGSVAPKADAELKWKLWVSSEDGRDTILIDGPLLALSSAGWNPRTLELTYVRVLDGSRAELVSCRPGQLARVLYEQKVKPDQKFGQGLSRQAPAWTSDGSLVAFPSLVPPGLRVLELSSKRVVIDEPGASSPSWSPDGRMLAFLVAIDDYRSDLVVIEVATGVRRSLGQVAWVAQPPKWLPDGGSLITPTAQIVEGGHSKVELLAIDATSGARVKLRELDLPFRPHDSLRGVSFAADAVLSRQYASVGVAGRDAAVSTAVAMVPRERTHPFDAWSIPLALSSHPTKAVVALRFVSPDRPEVGVPAIWDPADKSLVPLCPDSATRRQWLTLLSASVRHRAARADEASGGVPTPTEARWAILPPDQPLPDDRPQTTWLRQTIQLGSAIAADDRAGSAGSDDVVPERFLFQALSRDYSRALQSLDELLVLVPSGVARHGWLQMRAQCLVALGDRGAAGEMLRYLVESVPRRVGRIEGGPPESLGLTLPPTDRRASALLRSLESGGSRPAQSPATRLRSLQSTSN